MKYVDIPELEALVSEFNTISNADSRLFGTAEMFTLKLAGDDKQLYHELNRNYEAFALSPTNLSVSPFGPLTDSSSRKILISFVTTLNQVYHGYEFSEVRGNDFSKEPNFAVAFNFINTSVSTSFPQYTSSGLNRSLWDLIQQNMVLEECEIYRFSPTSAIDPCADALWCLHYFFYNKKLKRVFYFACGAKLISQSYDSFMDDDVMDDSAYFDMEI